MDLFAKAKEPDKIVVGIVDQSYEEDLLCLEAYCKEMGEYFIYIQKKALISFLRCQTTRKWTAMPFGSVIRNAR